MKALLYGNAELAMVDETVAVGDKGCLPSHAVTSDGRCIL